MLTRKTTGSVVCPSCGRLTGVLDERCYSCGRWNPGLWGYGPLLGKLGTSDQWFAQIVIAGCGLLFAATLLASGGQIGMRGLFSLLAPSNEALFLFGSSGTIPIFQAGRWWTVLSAAWLHGGLIHIAMNMYWILQLIPVVAGYFGVGRLVIIYTASSAAGFLLTSIAGLLPLPGPLHGAAFTVGASAPLFGLFGAMMLYGQRSGNRAVSKQMLQFVVIWLVIGVLVSSGNMVLMDNWAHLGGFLGGYLAARWLDPLRPEGPQHLVGALVCLVLTLLSIIASVLHGMQFIA